MRTERQGGCAALVLRKRGWESRRYDTEAPVRGLRLTKASRYEMSSRERLWSRRL